MKYFNVSSVTLICLVSCTTALVHYKKLEKGENGCKAPDGSQLKVGDTADDKETCGLYVCQNTEGDALIHYCQKPAPFENCVSDGVSTTTPFPECCWKCVKYEKCAGNGTPAPAGEGTATKEPEGDGATTKEPAGDATPEGDTKKEPTTENPAAERAFM